MTTLFQLPDELVGLIFRNIPDDDRRRGFYTCCQTMHTMPSILRSFTRLRIQADQSVMDGVLAFPKGSSLDELVIENHDGLHIQLHELETHGQARSVVQNVSKLIFKGEGIWNVTGEGALAIGYAIRIVMPHVSELHIKGGQGARLLVSGLLSTFASSPSLTTLKISPDDFSGDVSASVAAIDSISSIPNLRSLEFGFAFDVDDVISISPLTRCTKLQELHFMNSNAECEVDFASVVRVLQACPVKVLSLRCPPSKSSWHSLAEPVFSTSLEVLKFFKLYEDDFDDVSGLDDLHQFFPSLRRVQVEWVDIGAVSTVQACERLLRFITHLGDDDGCLEFGLCCSIYHFLHLMRVFEGSDHARAITELVIYLFGKTTVDAHFTMLVRCSFPSARVYVK